jgi:hypothetical protein
MASVVASTLPARRRLTLDGWPSMNALFSDNLLLTTHFHAGNCLSLHHRRHLLLGEGLRREKDDHIDHQVPVRRRHSDLDVRFCMNGAGGDS